MARSPLDRAFSEPRNRREFLRAAASGAALATMGGALAACGSDDGDAAEGGRSVIRFAFAPIPCGTT